MSKLIEMEISPDILKNRLENLLSKAGEENAELVSRIIIENLACTELGIPQLVSAFLGVEEKHPWLVGDKVLFPFKDVYSWYCDKDAMKEKNYNLFKDHVVGYIKEINPRKKEGVQFQFDCIKNDGNGKLVFEKCTMQVSIKKIKFPKDLPSDFEQKRENVASIG